MNEYVSDIISIADIQSWKKNDNILISAGTGQGKSSFVLNKLYHYAREQEEKILLLVPRVLIKEQFLREQKNNIQNITIQTYQWLENLEDINSELTHYDYIVADEAHYFLRDSSFNYNTRKSLMSLFNSSSRCLYMSATLNTFESLLRALNQTIDHYYSVTKEYDYIKKAYLFSGSNDKSLEYIEKQLYSIINNNEKAIVFINNTKDIELLYNKFKRNSTVLFNNHYSKNLVNKKIINETEVAQILQEQMLPKNILFTTSILEMGVTIKDRQLKHIFTDGYNLENIVQMIGRKRQIDDEDYLNIHVKDYNRNQLAGHKRYLTEQKKRLSLLQEKGDTAFLKELGENAFHQLFKRGGVYSEPSGDNIKVKPNPLYFANLNKQLSMINTILKNKELTFAKLLHSELGISFEEQEVRSNKELLHEYLQSKVNIRLYTKEQKEELAERIDYRVNYRLQKSIGKLNEYIQSGGLPFTIVAKKDGQRNIVNSVGKKVKNNNFGKRYWTILYNEDKGE